MTSTRTEASRKKSDESVYETMMRSEEVRKQYTWSLSCSLLSEGSDW